MQMHNPSYPGEAIRELCLEPMGLIVTKAHLGPGKGIFYRLRAGPIANETAARTLCQQLTKRKIGCLIIKPPR